MMMLAAVCVLLTAAVAVLAALWRGEARAALASRAAHTDMVAQAATHYSQMLALATSRADRAEARVREERDIWINAVREATQEHQRVLGEVHERHAQEVTRLVALSSFGTTTPGDAIRIPAKEGPEDRMQREISESAIARGTAEIRARYKTLGIEITEEEARTQATSMLSFRTPPIEHGPTTEPDDSRT